MQATYKQVVIACVSTITLEGYRNLYGRINNLVGLYNMSLSEMLSDMSQENC